MGSHNSVYFPIPKEGIVVELKADENSYVQIDEKNITQILKQKHYATEEDINSKFIKFSDLAYPITKKRIMVKKCTVESIYNYVKHESMDTYEIIDKRNNAMVTFNKNECFEDALECFTNSHEAVDCSLLSKSNILIQNKTIKLCDLYVSFNRIENAIEKYNMTVTVHNYDNEGNKLEQNSYCNGKLIIFKVFHKSINYVDEFVVDKAGTKEKKVFERETVMTQVKEFTNSDTASNDFSKYVQEKYPNIQTIYTKFNQQFIDNNSLDEGKYLFVKGGKIVLVEKILRKGYLRNAYEYVLLEKWKMIGST